MRLCEYTQILSEVQSSQFIIIDKLLCSYYPDILEALKFKEVYFIDNPESSKNYALVGECLEFFLSKKISRDDTIVVIGGGATSDFGGFVAATILRGVNWKVIPTTLLSMIDASIGGKVGVNSIHGKNLIGNFHEPIEILFCEKFLGTLDVSQLNSGKGELLKYAFLDQSIYSLILNGGLNSELIMKCAQFKMDIVQRDLKEASERKLLNFGHTFGHVFEKKLGILHGDAVNLGIQFILDLYRTDLTEVFKSLRREIKTTESILNPIDFDSFWETLEFDKKISSDKVISLILPVSMGECFISEVSLNELKQRIKKMANYACYFK